MSDRNSKNGKNEKKGYVEHKKNLIKFEDGGCEQVDMVRTHIPLDVVGEHGIALLAYWNVDTFDYAEIDWDKGEIIIHYQTEHDMKAQDVEDDDAYDEVIDFEEGA